MLDKQIKCHKETLSALGESVSVKSVKVNLGPKRSGAVCTVLLNNKKAFEFKDEGSGFESKITPLNEDVYRATALSLPYRKRKTSRKSCLTAAGLSWVASTKLNCIL